MIAIRQTIIVAAFLLLAACGGDRSTPVPPRISDEMEVQQATSVVAVPVSADLIELERMINAQVPETLLSLDRRESACGPEQRLKLGSTRTRITPNIGCNLIGNVKRGHIQLSGSGKDILLRMPFSAEVSARNLAGGISQTANGAAEVRALIRLGMTAQWQPTAKIEIDYDWTEEPGINLLGRRFSFADKADPVLRRILGQLERQIPAQLQRLQYRPLIEDVWKEGFVSLELNRRNPAVWLRVTPQQIGYGGYDIADGKIVLKLALEANAETIVGRRPAVPEATPLPQLSLAKPESGFRVIVPVLAEYDELEAVLGEALQNLSGKPIHVRGLGPVEARFGQPTIFATTGNRLAVGLPIRAHSRGRWVKGTVWMTGMPRNQLDSPVIEMLNLRVTGDTDSRTTNRLVRLINMPIVRRRLQAALRQDFSKELAELRVKTDAALENKQVGPFLLDVQFGQLRFGQARVLGQGVYLPVELTGKGRLSFAPQPAQ